MRIGALTFGIAAAFALVAACSAFGTSLGDASPAAEAGLASADASGGTDGGVGAGDAAVGDASSSVVPLVTLVDGATDPITAVAADESYAYFTRRSSGIIARVALAGGSPAELPIEHRAPGDIVVTSEALFWINGNAPGEVYRAALDGTAAVSLWTSGDPEVPQALAVTPSQVVVATFTTLAWLDRQTGVVNGQAFDLLAPFGPVTVGEYAYWSESGSSQGHVWRAASSYAEVSSFASGQPNPESIAASADSLAWVSYFGQSLTTAALAGGSQTLRSTNGRPTGVAADASGVYVLVERTDEADDASAVFHAMLQRFPWTVSERPELLVTDIVFAQDRRSLHKIALTKDYVIVAGRDALLRVSKNP